MEFPSESIREKWLQAIAYDEQGDIYNAVKLFRLIVREVPEWLPPFLRLQAIYKKRAEWKAALHFAKKAVALDAGNRRLWWDLGIAAAACGKDRLARNVWQKFANTPEVTLRKVVSLRREHSGLFELLWARPLDPVRAEIISVPHPASDRHFLDVVLYDQETLGYQVSGRKRYPVFADLDLVKRSFYQTFSCILEEGSETDVHTLEQLCLSSGLGFEVWSNAARAATPMPRRQLPEFYSDEWTRREAGPGVLVAIAARREDQVREVLHAWEVITLKAFTDLECH